MNSSVNPFRRTIIACLLASLAFTAWANPPGLQKSAEYANTPFDREAAMAESFGLPHEEALRAITLYPAQILGVGDRLGSLEKGKDATVMVTDGDPLDIRTQVLQLWIDGRPVDRP